MRRFVVYILSTILPIGSAWMYSADDTFFSTITDDGSRLIVMSGVIVMAVAVLGVIDTYWIYIPWLRHRLSRRYSIEGCWIECLHSHSTPVSYARISFEDNEFFYQGENFDHNLRHVANFRSTSVDVSETGRKMHFEFVGDILKENSNGEPDQVRGYGKITFSTDGHWRYRKGEGYFVEGDSSNRVFIELYKVHEEELLGVVSKVKGLNPEDIKKVVTRWLEKPWFAEKCGVPPVGNLLPLPGKTT